MNLATAIVVAAGMICSTVLLVVWLAGREARRLVRDVLDEIKVAGRTVSVSIDKKVNVHVGEDSAESPKSS